MKAKLQKCGMWAIRLLSGGKSHVIKGKTEAEAIANAKAFRDANPARNRPPLSEEEKAEIRILLRTVGYKTAAKRIGRGACTVRAFCKSEGLRCPDDGRFKKGSIPFTKGKKMADYASPEAIERSSRTRFAKGMEPWNKKSVGYVKTDADGTVFVKVSEELGGNAFTTLARKVWEDAHGELPAEIKVYHLDGDKSNNDLRNLCLGTSQTQFDKCHWEYDGLEPKDMVLYLQNQHVSRKISDRARAIRSKGRRLRKNEKQP